ncbi:Tyrosine aminotransferase, partial [Pseudolycoriella hygida]
DKHVKNARVTWNVKQSSFALNTINPIRQIVDNLKIEPNPEKHMIPLSIGDPTTFGNLLAARETIEAVKEVIDSGAFNGYGHAAGLLEARQAVCDYVEECQGKVTPNDVILCSGCSCALDMSIAVLGDPGKNILIPRPGFSIYRTLAVGHGIEVRSYELLPERGWEADLQQMESLIDENTVALVVTNPSNPCGSVFLRDHLMEIINLAERYYLPIIADEIYEHFVFPGTDFVSVSSLSKTVPVLSCGGLTKRFLVPGWRIGWIVIHDRNDVFKDVRKGLSNLSNRILGCNSLIQGALPSILRNTPQSFFDNLINVLYKNAQTAFQLIRKIPGLRPIMPEGAMYMMIGIDVDRFPEYSNELNFVQDLVKEESVFCLPGQCFDYPNYMRIVLTVPEEMIIEACGRIAEFCENHYKIDSRIIENEILRAVDIV